MFNTVQFELNKQHQQDMQRQAEKQRLVNQVTADRKNRVAQMMASVWNQMAAMTARFSVRPQEAIQLRAETR